MCSTASTYGRTFASTSIGSAKRICCFGKSKWEVHGRESYFLAAVLALRLQMHKPAYEYILAVKGREGREAMGEAALGPLLRELPEDERAKLRHLLHEERELDHTL
jgi:hypothetical protein